MPYGRQHITESDIEAVIAVLKSDYITQGPKVPEFESALCAYTGANYGVATNSATSSLHLACLALGVGPGDTVWTSAITFVASANCAEYCGAEVNFVDVEPETFNMDIVDLEKRLVRAEAEGRLPKIVIPVHMAGQPCDMLEISRLAKKYGFRIIEDASHAVGAEYLDSKIGSCKYSDITVFSFHPVKIITTGEGGVALTNDLNIAKRMARLRSHGVTRDQSEMSSLPHGAWYYEQSDLGFNYRMTEMQAALGISQLARVNEYVAKRNTISDQYRNLLKAEYIDKPIVKPNRKSSFHLYIIRINASSPKMRNEIFEKLRADGIQVNLHYLPVYRHPYYQNKYGYNPVDFPNAEKYYCQAISIPMFPSLEKGDLAKVARSLLAPIGHQTIF